MGRFLGLVNQTSQPCGEMGKLDMAAVDGLTGVEGSLAYHVVEIERHLHGWERWAGLLVPAAGGKVANWNSSVPFRVTTDAAADTFGLAVQTLDVNDTPVTLNMVHYDLHQIFIVNVQAASTFRLRLAFGRGGLYANNAAAVAAGWYTDVVFKVNNLTQDGQPLNVMTRREDVGSKMWVSVANAAAVAVWIDLVFGLHEYEG